MNSNHINSIVRTIFLYIFALILSSCGGNNLLNPNDNHFLLPMYRNSHKVNSALISLKNKNIDIKELYIGDNTNLNVIRLRVNYYHSPYGNSFAKYIEEAAKIELKLANMYKNGSSTYISGKLIENDMSTRSGFGHIKVLFCLANKNRKIFEKEIIGQYKWETSFIGIIAYNNATESYQYIVQNLLYNLFSDEDFVKAINSIK